MLLDAGLTACKPVSAPLPTGLHLSTDSGDILPNPEQYRRLIGWLLYLNLTRPDLPFAIQHLSQFLSQPRKPHFDAAIHVLRYLKGTLHKGLFYSTHSTLNVMGYSDADWGGCVFSRKSVSGYCVFLGTSLVSWKTKKQKTTSKSSAESKYRCMSAAASELV